MNIPDGEKRKIMAERLAAKFVLDLCESILSDDEDTEKAIAILQKRRYSLSYTMYIINDLGTIEYHAAYLTIKWIDNKVKDLKRSVVKDCKS